MSSETTGGGKCAARRGRIVVGPRIRGHRKSSADQGHQGPRLICSSPKGRASRQVPLKVSEPQGFPALPPRAAEIQSMPHRKRRHSIFGFSAVSLDAAAPPVYRRGAVRSAPHAIVVGENEENAYQCNSAGRVASRAG